MLKRILISLINNAIQEEIMMNLFTPLFTTKSKSQGFGLVVVKRMTVALGRNVYFESEMGKGAK